MYFLFSLFFFFNLLEAVYQLLFKSSVCARSEPGEAVNQLEAMNQWMASCVAQRTASCEAQPLLLLFLQLNLVFKSC